MPSKRAEPPDCIRELTYYTCIHVQDFIDKYAD